jgi:hypothetical protein
MSCKYADGTEMKVGDIVQYETIDMESFSRGYGIMRETHKSKIVDFKVVLANGDIEVPKKLIKQSGGKRRSTTRKRKE